MLLAFTCFYSTVAHNFGRLFMITEKKVSLQFVFQVVYGINEFLVCLSGIHKSRDVHHDVKREKNRQQKCFRN